MQIPPKITAGKSSQAWRKDLLLSCLFFFGLISVNIGQIAREREKDKEKIDERKIFQTTPPAPTATTVDPCPTVIQI